MLRNRFKESSDLERQIADDLGIETLTIADLKETFTDFVKELLQKDYRIEACSSNRKTGEVMSCYLTKDGSSLNGIEMYKMRENRCDVILIVEEESSDLDIHHVSSTDVIKFYVLDDNHIYSNYEDMKTVDSEVAKLI